MSCILCDGANALRITQFALQLSNQRSQVLMYCVFSMTLVYYYTVAGPTEQKRNRHTGTRAGGLTQMTGIIEMTRRGTETEVTGL